MDRFAIVHWEDNFVSFINLESVREPKKPISDYNEFAYIKATYGKKPNKVRIWEKHGVYNPRDFPKILCIQQLGL